MVLTDGETFANALSGCYLAKINDAPLLFVDSEDLSKSLDYISRSIDKNGTIYVIDEITGLTNEMIKNNADCNVVRIEGNDIYEINLNALKTTDISTDRILVCTGENFADSISAIATGLPILLVKDTISDYQIKFIQENKGKSFAIIGGTIAVNEKVETELQQYGETERIKGRTRYDTSAVIAGEFFEKPESVVLTSGKVLTNGFCSGVYAAHIGSPMLLANKGNIDAATSYVVRNKIRSGIVIGGENVVGNLTANDVFGLTKKEEE